MIRDVPPGPDSVERLAGLLGFIRETSYGRVFGIKTVAENRTLAETRHAIAPHSGELFRDAPPGRARLASTVPGALAGEAPRLRPSMMSRPAAA